MAISPELQAKIDALSDEDLKANILRYLGRPWKREKSNEQVFEEMLAESEEYAAQKSNREARAYAWREDEVVAFAFFFNKNAPELYADYLSQERNGRQIDAELSIEVRRLAEEWMPGLEWDDYGELFGKLRSYAEESLI